MLDHMNTSRSAPRVDLRRSRSGVSDLGGTTVVLVRHAECAAQVALRDGIDALDSPLTERGTRQAEAVASALTRLEPDVVLSSPMTRAVQPGSAIARATDAPLLCWRHLREVLGREVHIQRTHADLTAASKLVPNFDWDDRPGWLHGDRHYVSMRRRAAMVVRRLLRDFAAPSVVVAVSHGGFGSYLIGAALGVRSKPGTWFQLDNASISILRFPAYPDLERSGWDMFPPVAVEVVSLNDVGHLRPELREATTAAG